MKIIDPRFNSVLIRKQVSLLYKIKQIIKEFSAEYNVKIFIYMKHT